jgi:hypothetical protein
VENCFTGQDVQGPASLPEPDRCRSDNELSSTQQALNPAVFTDPPKERRSISRRPAPSVSLAASADIRVGRIRSGVSASSGALAAKRKALACNFTPPNSVQADTRPTEYWGTFSAA